MTFKFVSSLIVCASIVITSSESLAEPTFIRPEIGTVEVERDNGPVKKCEIVIPLVKVPETVVFRVKVLVMGGDVLRAFTVDVVQFKRVSNGIPYEPEKKPITSARVLANNFDSDKVSRRVDMGDGGIGYVLNSDTNFFSLLDLVKRGDYYVMFKRSDKPDLTSYVVGEKVDVKFFREFASCAAAM